MIEVLELAEEAEKRGEIPVAAIIVDSKNSQIITKTYNKVETSQDPTAHAEIIAIRDACYKLNSKRLIDFDLYTNLEPCPMCAQAISNAKIRRLYFGAYDTKMGGVFNGARIFNQSSCFHKPEIYAGIYREQSEKLIKNFFKKIRSA